MNKIPAGCEGCRNCMYWERNGCMCWKKQLKKTTVWLVQPYHIKKEQGRKLKRYPCIQGYGLYKGGMYIVEEQKDVK